MKSQLRRVPKAMIINLFWHTSMTQLPQALRHAKLPWPDFVSTNPEAIRTGLLACRWLLTDHDAIECFFDIESECFENWESHKELQLPAHHYTIMCPDEAISSILRLDPNTQRQD